MKVVWSDRALRSLAEIHSRISTDSETTANQIVDGILRWGDRISQFPRLGRLVDRYDDPYRSCIAVQTNDLQRAGKPRCPPMKRVAGP